MAFIEERLPSDGEMHARSLAQQIEAELGLSIHPRSIERAIMHKKKTRLESALTAPAASYITTYEALRANVLAQPFQPEGLAALRYHGMFPGLVIILRTPTVPPTVTNDSFNLPLPRDNIAMVRLLANFLLHTYSEHTHVC